jgi:hypothetical protein
LIGRDDEHDCHLFLSRLGKYPADNFSDELQASEGYEHSDDPAHERVLSSLVASFRLRNHSFVDVAEKPCYPQANGHDESYQKQIRPDDGEDFGGISHPGMCHPDDKPEHYEKNKITTCAGLEEA